MGCARWRGGRPKKLAVAFYCWVRGYFKAENKKRLAGIPRATKESEKEAIEFLGERFDRSTFPGYDTPIFWEALQIWRDWKSFGFPWEGGTLNQGALYFDILRIMQTCGRVMKVE